MLLDYIRQIHAAQNFIIKDNFEFIEFEDVTLQDIVEHQAVPESIELWGVVKVYYDGQIPESYKVLNLMIGDWVEKNTEKLTELLHKELKAHFQEHYPESDISELDQIDDSAIWGDQLDYMPVVNPNDQTMTIEIELVLHAEHPE